MTKSFATMLVALNTPAKTGNPRIAAGMTPVEWDRTRRLRRRLEFETRHGIFQPSADAANNCALPDIKPHDLLRPDRGPTAARYYREKWRRLGGTLGTHEALNPFLPIFRKGPQ